MNLLKVTLSSVEATVCSEFYPPDRKLKSGLSHEQMCAVDPEGRQDTCMGDSGGPLQIKLLGGSRMHPFIIGVTSFGKGCGTETPGVYVRLSEYKDWIKTVSGISLEPKDCVSQYTEFREYEPDIVTSKPSYNEFYNFKNAHVNVEPYPMDYVARIGWQKRRNEYDWTCGGTFITGLYVLTSVSCLNERNSKPSKVKSGNSDTEQMFNVTKIIIHPKYKLGSLENDIALVLLDKEVRFSKYLHPICLWDKEEMPKEELEVIGLTSTEIHKPYLLEYANKTMAYTSIRSSQIPTSECSTFHRKNNITITDNHICHANSLYIIPNSCQLDFGGPVVKRQQRFKDGFYSYQFGINIQGKDCGFGHATVATKVSRYINWIDSVIFEKINGHDKCQLPNGKQGLCKKSSECMDVVNMVKRGEVNLSDFICDFTDKRDPRICCP